MQDRLSFLLRQLNLTPSQFADKLGINRATVSHLLSGRNKPSMTLVQDLLTRFTNVNPDWLILGKGSWERSSPAAVAPRLEFPEADLAEVPAPEVQSQPVAKQVSPPAPAPDEENPVIKMILVRRNGSIEEYGRG